MRKTIATVALAAGLTVVAGQASAHGGYGGGAIAGALIGGAVIGAVVGSAANAPPPVVYAAPPVYNAPVVYQQPAYSGPPPGYCYDRYHRAYVQCAPVQGYYAPPPPPGY